MECPKCHLVNPDTAIRCDCGYDFQTRQMEESYLKPSNPTPTPVPMSCKVCGTSLPTGAVACWKCGTPVISSTSSIFQRGEVKESKPESRSRSTPGCTGYPIIGAFTGGCGLLIIATLAVYVVLIAIIYSLFSNQYGWFAALLLGITGGAIGTVIALVFGGVETVGVALAFIGAVMGLFDGVVAWFVSLVTRAPGIVTAIATAFICGVAIWLIGSPFYTDSTWLGVFAFCAIFNAIVGGITGFMSAEAWEELKDNRPEWQKNLGIGR